MSERWEQQGLFDFKEVPVALMTVQPESPAEVPQEDLPWVEDLVTESAEPAQEKTTGDPAEDLTKPNWTLSFKFGLATATAEDRGNPCRKCGAGTHIANNRRSCKLCGPQNGLR